MSDGELIISKIEPEQIPGLWPLMVTGVQEIYKFSGGTFGWKPEDVRQHLLEKKALACFGYVGGKRVGFMVLRFFEEDFTRKKYVHVWLTYIYPKWQNRGLLEQGWSWLENEARKVGAAYIEMDTNRQGWRLLSKKLGLLAHRTVYRKEI